MTKINWRRELMLTAYLVPLFLLAVYVTVLAYLYFFQRNMIYVPERNMGKPEEYGLLHVDELRLETADNITITAWHSPPPSPNAPTLVYFHGNAGKLADRSEKLGLFIQQGLGLMALSYRGYGNSGGKPTELGLYDDARTVMNYLLDHGTSVENIILYGESLGSGVAVQMATEYKAKALVLEAPYTSISRRAAEIYPYIPVRFLLKDHFNSIEKITHIHSPLLIFHGELDPTIPIAHGKELFATATVLKEMKIYPEVGHTEFDLPLITKLTAEFAGSEL